MQILPALPLILKVPVHSNFQQSNYKNRLSSLLLRLLPLKKYEPRPLRPRKLALCELAFSRWMMVKANAALNGEFPDQYSIPH